MIAGLFNLAAATETAYSYSRPFLQPLPVWDEWPWLLLPLCVGVAVVYKSIKCHSMKRVPWEATVITGWILAGFAVAAAGLAGVVKFMQYWKDNHG